MYTWRLNLDHNTPFHDTGNRRTQNSYMASASIRHSPARLTFWAFHAGALHIAADRSKSAAASLSSAAERGPASQASPYAPLST
eukprot:scaffold36894_cov63-Phaeocystis_antarctica.AAC.3